MVEKDLKPAQFSEGWPATRAGASLFYSLITHPLSPVSSRCLCKMADLESVLADVSYLMAMERSKAPGAKTIRKFTLPDRR